MALFGTGELAAALSERLERLGLQPVRIERRPHNAEEAHQAAEEVRRAGQVGGLVFLETPSPERHEESDGDGLCRANLGCFLLAQALGSDLTAAGPTGFGILAVTGMGGSWGLDEGGGSLAGAALGGLAKSLARELPGVVVKAVDVAPGDPAELAERLVEEQLGGDPAVEVGLPPSGRVTVRCVAEPAAGAEIELSDESVVLLTGGARGITAEVAVALAERFRPRLVLAGRTPAPSEIESAGTRGLTDLAEIKSALGRELAARGEEATPASIERAYRRLSAEREVRATLQRLEETGARVEYAAVDVRDEAAFGALLDGIYERYDRLDGVIHGAGTIEDKRLADKTPEMFERVFRTKVDPALTLVRKLRADDLRFLIFFSSVAGRFGNLGQTDYAAANELLSKLARRLDAEWDARVVAVAWGPWDEVGMVRPELRRMMRERGVALVPPRTGCQLLLDELRSGSTGEPEVVIAGLGAERGPAL